MTQHVTAAERAATRFRYPAAAPRRPYRPALARMALGAATAAAAATMSMACAPASAQALAGAAFAGFVAPGFALAGVDALPPGSAVDGATPTAARAHGDNRGDRTDPAGAAGTAGDGDDVADGVAAGATVASR